MSEKFANLAESTLASPYTAADPSITVASAALFPTTGVFRVALGNLTRTIFRVDSVAGTVFTGTAEAFDGNAATGNTVIQVGSRGTAERLLQSPESGEARAPSGISAVDFYGPLYKLAALDQSGFAWINQGPAVLVQANGIVFIRSDGSGAASDVHIRKKAEPTPPFTVTACIITKPADGADGDGSGANWLAIIFRDSGTGKFSAFTADRDGSIQVVRYDDVNTVNGISATRTTAFRGMPIWLQVEDDGVGNMIWRYSTDGINFETPIRSTGRTLGGFYTPDEVGFGLNAQGGLAAGDAGGSILSWLES